MRFIGQQNAGAVHERLKNYYAILEVPVGCSLEEIRQAYRRLAQENMDNEAAFTELTEAHEILTTPARRAEYDQAAWGETFSGVSSGVSLGAASPPPAAVGAARTGRCPMGAEAQCPVLSGHVTPTDRFCPECGFLLSALNGAGQFEAGGSAEPSQVARLEGADGRTHRLRPGLNTVGRESADVLLPDKTVSRAHARIHLGEDGSAGVEDLGSTNGTAVNDESLVPHLLRALFEGDRVRFGSIQTELRLPAGETAPGPAAPAIDSGEEAGEPDAAPAPPPRAARARVVETREGDAREYLLVPGVTTFGRRAENSVVIGGDPYVSGSHAQIIADGDDFQLTDVGSTNGTLLNGERLPIDSPVALSPGDVILIGGTALRFERIAPEDDSETASEEFAAGHSQDEQRQDEQIKEEVAPAPTEATAAVDEPAHIEG